MVDEHARKHHVNHGKRGVARSKAGAKQQKHKGLQTEHDRHFRQAVMLSDGAATQIRNNSCGTVEEQHDTYHPHRKAHAIFQDRRYVHVEHVRCRHAESFHDEHQDDATILQDYQLIAHTRRNIGGARARHRDKQQHRNNERYSFYCYKRSLDTECIGKQRANGRTQDAGNRKACVNK